MSAKLFEFAPGVTDLWFTESVKFDEAATTLTIPIDFRAASLFEVSVFDGVHGEKETVTKTYLYLKFFPRECQRGSLGC